VNKKTPSVMHPFITSLLDTYRNASREDLKATAEEVCNLLSLFAAMWASAGQRAVAESAEITTALQPIGEPPVRTPMAAATAMYSDMQNHPGLRNNKHLAACAHAVLRVIELLLSRHDEGDLSAIVAGFVPTLAPALLVERRPMNPA